MTPKLRAWDKEDTQMRDVLAVNFYHRVLSVEYENDQFVQDGMDRFIFMQYTGLKDKNGVEIYEGDIVERTYLFNGGYGETHTGEVVYDKEYARYVISRPQKHIEPKTEDLRNILSDKSTYEAIGNIYENPELLKEQNK